MTQRAQQALSNLRKIVGLRSAFNYLLLQPLDLALKWLHVCLKLQIVRLEALYLRFHFFKLTIEASHLRALISRQSDTDTLKGIRDYSHRGSPCDGSKV